MSIVIGLQKNMGSLDRIARGLIGAFLLLYNLQKGKVSGLPTSIGITLLANSITGFDPILAIGKTTTIPTAENNLWNLTKHISPGMRMPPRDTQFLQPGKRLLRPFSSNLSFAKALEIG